jgi:hypothetical protein
MEIETQPDGSIRIYPNRWKLWPLLLGAILFVVLGFEILGWREWAPLRLYHGIVALLAIVFFGACGILILGRILWRSPAVILSHQGITDLGSPLGAGFLSWDEVSFVSIYSYRGQRMLGVFPKDPDGFMSRLGAAKAWYMKVNMRMGFAPVNISQVILPGPIEELDELIRTRYGIESRASWLNP